MEENVDLTRNKITNALNKLNLSENANVTLKYKTGTQVFHYTGDYLDGAFNETNALYDVARVVAHEGIRKHNSLINNLRNNGALDDYERGSFEFEDHVYEAIREDWSEYVEESLEQWDHKRGMCNLTAEVEVPRNLIAEAEQFAFSLGPCWTVNVRTDNGNLELEF
jgi:hypothetical protein